MRRSIFACAAIAICACSGRTVTRYELASLGVDYGFFAVLDESGAVTRVIEPFGIAGGVLAFGVLPAIELTGGERDVVLVGLDAAMLSRLHAGFAAERADELRAALAVPPERAGAIDDRGEYFWRGPLPAEARLFSGELGDGEIQLAAGERFREAIGAAVTVDVPIDPEYCRVPAQSTLGPFADDRFAFLRIAETRMVHHVEDVRWLDRERALVVTWTMIAVVRPGEMVVPGPNVLQLSFDGPTPRRGIRAERFAIDRARSRVIVVGRTAEEAPSKIWEVELRGGEPVLISERDEPERALSDVAVLRDGRQIVSEHGGILHERNITTGELTEFARLERYYRDEDKPSYLLAIDDERHPFLATTDSRLHTYNAQADSFAFEELTPEGLTSFDTLTFTALAQGRTAGGDLDLWAGSERGRIYRRIGDGPWSRVFLNFPPRFEVCAPRDEMTGELLVGERYSSAALSADYLHLSLNNCSALIQVRRSDHCVSVLPRDGGAIEISGHPPQAIDVLDDQLIEGGVGGLLYRSTW